MEWRRRRDGLFVLNAEQVQQNNKEEKKAN
jgi:hypothetical protein